MSQREFLDTLNRIISKGYRICVRKNDLDNLGAGTPAWIRTQMTTSPPLDGGQYDAVNRSNGPVVPGPLGVDQKEFTEELKALLRALWSWRAVPGAGRPVCCVAVDLAYGLSSSDFAADDTVPLGAFSAPAPIDVVEDRALAKKLMMIEYEVGVFENLLVESKVEATRE